MAANAPRVTSALGFLVVTLISFCTGSTVNKIAAGERKFVNLRIRLIGEGTPVSGADVFVRTLDGRLSENHTTNNAGEIAMVVAPVDEVVIQVDPPKEWKFFGKQYDLKEGGRGKEEVILVIELSRKDKIKDQTEESPWSIFNFFNRSNEN